MPDGTRLEISGVRETVADLHRIGEEAADLRPAYQRVGELLTPLVAGLSRHRTGALAASWGAESAAGVARMTSGLDHAAPMEFGWPAHGIPATLAVFTAADAHAGEINAIYESELAAVIRKHGGAP